MNRKALIAAVVAAVAVVAVIVGVNVAGNSATAPNAASGVTSRAGTASSLLPVTANPIHNTSTASGLSITTAVAENNVDPSTKQPIADRLQVTLTNTSSSTLTGFEIFYTMTDAVTHASESYYLPLTGLTLAAGATTDIYFDGQAGAQHYAENSYSIYRSSKNKVDFAIEVSAQGVAVAKGTAVKGAGTGEVVGG
jgi:hypothetical protein